MNLTPSKARDWVLKNHLHSFVTKCFYTLNPGAEYLPNWHIDALIDHLLSLEKGETNRLIINMPPRYLKSLCVNVAWTAWLLGHNPKIRIISVSYSQRLSTKHMLDTKSIIQSDWYRKIFPSLKIRDDQNCKDKFETSEHGFRLAVSVGGTMTGEGGDVLIIDDPHNPVDIFSRAKREHVISWFEQVLMSRLNDKQKGIMVLIMQRLHDKDLSGRLLSSNQDNSWFHLSFPAIATESSRIKVAKRTYDRNEGDILHPLRENKHELDKLRSQMGSFAFSAQYQQQPIKQLSLFLKLVRRYDNIMENLTIVQSWDTANKNTETSDYSVCTTWGSDKNHFYLLDVARGRWDFPRLKMQFLAMGKKWKPSSILIEDKASGQQLLQESQAAQMHNVVAIMPKGDKMSRLINVIPLLEAGKVFLPNSAEWLIEFEGEINLFPGFRYDDQVDSMVQYLNWVKNYYMQYCWKDFSIRVL
jgi:predicted phage terminase large subunit-like protein